MTGYGTHVYLGSEFHIRARAIYVLNVPFSLVFNVRVAFNVFARSDRDNGSTDVDMLLIVASLIYMFKHQFMQQNVS